MSDPAKVVISASRRTDIPAFYMKWFMRQIEKGCFSIPHPYTGKPYTIQASPEIVHTIVFWSKNIGPFLQGGYGEALLRKGYQLFFNLTVNSASHILEPAVPPLAKRLKDIEALSRRFGAERLRWRFDPICFFKDAAGGTTHNMQDFVTIAEHMATCGVTDCITSFVDVYAKVKKRPGRYPGFAYVDPGLEEKVAILLTMEQILSDLGMGLYTCCEKTVMAHLPETSTIQASACIPSDRLMALGKGLLSLKRDTGQRIEQGCNCMVSKDIGSYRLHPCYHACHFCYANPVPLNPNHDHHSGGGPPCG